MKIRILLGVVIFMAMALLLGLRGDSFGWGNKAKQPSPEITAEVKKALSERIFEGDNEPEEEETRYIIIYFFSSNPEKCEVCAEDIRNMFDTVFFKTEYSYSGPVSLYMTTEDDSSSTLEYLTQILASVFSENKADPEKISLYLGALHMLVECKADFADLKAARLPVIIIADTTKEDEENEGVIYLSSGSKGPWAKIDQIIVRP
jgi:hypothetical protein